jgi:hypothetical protein
MPWISKGLDRREVQAVLHVTRCRDPAVSG